MSWITQVYESNARRERALDKIVPEVIQGLTKAVADDLHDTVWWQLSKVWSPGKPPHSAVIALKYDWLVKHKYMDSLTPEQISEANQEVEPEEEDHVMSNAKEFF